MAINNTYTQTLQKFINNFKYRILEEKLPISSAVYLKTEIIDKDMYIKIFNNKLYFGKRFFSTDLQTATISRIFFYLEAMREASGYNRTLHNFLILSKSDPTILSRFQLIVYALNAIQYSMIENLFYDMREYKTIAKQLKDSYNVIVPMNEKGVQATVGSYKANVFSSDIEVYFKDLYEIFTSKRIKDNYKIYDPIKDFTFNLYLSYKEEPYAKDNAEQALEDYKQNEANQDQDQDQDQGQDQDQDGNNKEGDTHQGLQNKSEGDENNTNPKSTQDQNSDQNQDNNENTKANSDGQEQSQTQDQNSQGDSHSQNQDNSQTGSGNSQGQGQANGDGNQEATDKNNDKPDNNLNKAGWSSKSNIQEKEQSQEQNQSQSQGQGSQEQSGGNKDQYGEEEQTQSQNGQDNYQGKEEQEQRYNQDYEEQEQRYNQGQNQNQEQQYTQENNPYEEDIENSYEGQNQEYKNNQSPYEEDDYTEEFSNPSDYEDYIDKYQLANEQLSSKDYDYDNDSYNNNNPLDSNNVPLSSKFPTNRESIEEYRQDGYALGDSNLVKNGKKRPPKTLPIEHMDKYENLDFLKDLKNLADNVKNEIYNENDKEINHDLSLDEEIRAASIMNQKLTDLTNMGFDVKEVEANYRAMKLKSKALPWNSVLTEWLKSKCAKPVLSYMKPNKRYLYAGLVLPSNVYIKPGQFDKIVAFIDTSGSVSTEEINYFMKVLLGLKNRFKDIEVYSFNDEMAKVKLKVNSDVNIGGGTNIRLVCKAIESMKSDKSSTLFIIFTDGMYSTETLIKTVNDANVKVAILGEIRERYYNEYLKHKNFKIFRIDGKKITRPGNKTNN